MERVYEVILRIENLHVYIKSAHILHGINLEIRPEDSTIGIIGRNGMGKTTLVKSIMGLLPAKEGRILFNGQEITNLRPYQISRKGIGYVPQGRGIFPSLSVEEHLIISQRNVDGGRWSIDRAYELFPELKRSRKKRACELSGGQQQMLAIARALVLNPSFLLLDEPSEGLAPVIVKELIDIIKELECLGVRVLIVEQNLFTICSLVQDNIYVMASGRIVDKVSREELMYNAEVRERYLGVSTSRTNNDELRKAF